jgi:hypothetical protein
MKGHSMDSNVYYLPLAADVVPEPKPQRGTLPRRLRHAWWRLRVAVAEIRAILRPRHRSAVDESLGWLDVPRGTVEARSRQRPARVIDLETARVRLRPAAGD